MTENKDAVSCFLEKLLSQQPDRENTVRKYAYFEIEKTGFAGPNSWFKIKGFKNHGDFLTYDSALEAAKDQMIIKHNDGLDFRIVEKIVTEKITYIERDKQ